MVFANELLSSLNMKEKNKIKAIKAFNEMTAKVIYGQQLDILSEMEEITIEDISLIHRLKTAAYTIEGPLIIGALLAGAKNLKTFSKYAIPLGKAFQMQDDILGVFGDEKKLGKPIGSDIKEGKQTILILKALEVANDKQKKIITKNLGNKKLTKNFEVYRIFIRIVSSTIV